ncbi:MAG: hypothetical protein EHM55_00655 [Acidobacteria bacterium]|nr:MAG: hypothetical protein EHM55_00655 [Acidobacteriota bacterium]
MARKINRPASRRRSTRLDGASPRTGVSRREYAELVVRLGSVELQLQRSRAELEVHARRIAQLQEQLESLKAATPAPAIAEIAALPLPPKPVVES